jgi:hypothetical protein
MRLPGAVHAMSLHDPDAHFERPERVRRSSIFNDENFPETFNAVLMCEGPCERPMAHGFHGKRSIECGPSESQRYVEHIFRCSRCGQLRVWGSETHVQNRSQQS